MNRPLLHFPPVTRQSMLARASHLRVASSRARNNGLLAVVTGAVTGLAVAGFDRLVATNLFDRVLRAPLWFQAGAPALGLLIAAVILRTIGRGASPATADEYIKDFHDTEGEFDQRSVPARVLASIATLGSGGAMGFEGPSMYIGASIGSWIQSHWPKSFSREDNKLLLVCGAAAGVAAIFKAPATGMVYALEVPYRQDLARRMLLPAMFSAASSYVVYVAVNGIEPLFPVAGIPALDLRDLGGAAALGLLAGVGGRGAAWLLRKAKSIAAGHPITVRLPVVAACLIAVFAATRGLTGQSLAIGSGYGAVTWALQPGHAVLTGRALFLLRMAAPPLVVGGGGVGGLFVPLVVQGALLGAFVGTLVNPPDPSFFPILGVAAFLGAGYRVPLAAVVFVAETTGRPGFVVPALIAAATSQLLMGESSVSPYQEGARTSLLSQRLALPITAALRTDAATVPPDATLNEFFDHHVSQLRLRAVPVVDGSSFFGVIYLPDMGQRPRAEWDTTTVGEVARTDVPVGQISWTLEAAVHAMEAGGVDRLPVLDGDAYVGVVTTGEVLKLDDILERAETVT